MKKLLDHSLRPLIIYAFTVLVISIPVYFLIIDWIWENELDKHHYAIREKLEKRLTRLNMTTDAVTNMIGVLDQVQPGFSFNETSVPQPDSLYTVIRFDTFMNDREQFRCLLTDIRIQGKLYRVLIETNMEEIDETILAIAGATFFIIVLLLAGFIYLNRRTALKVWKPFYDSLASLRNFRLDSGQPATLPVSEITEFTDLNASLTQLMDSSLSSYRQQKEFTENASHELQTPLAIVKSKLDMLLQSRSLDRAQMRTVEEAHQSINRVSRINKNLLLLAKIEHSQFEETQRIDVSEALQSLTDQFEDHFANHAQHYSVDTEPCEVEANPVLVEILLTNLLVNAVRYTPAGGTIRADLHRRRLLFSNTGSVPLQEQNLFRRFAQASSAHAGSGLGLAITREICERYHWQITYRFESDMHHFEVAF